MQIPKTVTELHHEIELGVVVGQRGRDVHRDSAMQHVAGYVLALDMTARNLQAIAKAKGQPWSVAKVVYLYLYVSVYLFIPLYISLCVSLTLSHCLFLILICPSLFSFFVLGLLFDLHF